MLLRAQRDFDLDLAASVLVGDQLSDIEAGAAAGVGTTILLRSSGTPESGHAHHHVAHSLDDLRHRFFTPTVPLVPETTP
jgi:histidinol phosphatase-like enzyme